MKINKKVIKRIISVLCAVSISTTCIVSSVGAVSVAPNMVNDQVLLDGVYQLNSKLDRLNGCLEALTFKLSSEFEKLNNDDSRSELKLAIMSISDLRKYVLEVKHIYGVNDENSVDKLCQLIDDISEYIKDRIQVDVINILCESDELVKDIASYKSKMADCVKCLINNDN